MTTIHTTPIAERPRIEAFGCSVNVVYQESLAEVCLFRHFHEVWCGYWSIGDVRRDEHGREWRSISKAVMDDFGALVEVKQ